MSAQRTSLTVVEGLALCLDDDVMGHEIAIALIRLTDPEVEWDVSMRVLVLHEGQPLAEDYVLTIQDLVGSYELEDGSYEIVIDDVQMYDDRSGQRITVLHADDQHDHMRSMLYPAAPE